MANQGDAGTDATWFPPLSEAKRWYVVYTKPRAEHGVAKMLVRLGFDVIYLHYRGTLSHARREIAVLKPLFPRYVIVGCRPEQPLATINATPSVSTVIYSNNTPHELSDDAVAELRGRGDKNGLLAAPGEKRGREPEYMAGEWVRIVDGPLTGFLASVINDNGKTVRVMVAGSKRHTSYVAFPEHVQRG